jgi:hypothetical protein
MSDDARIRRLEEQVAHLEAHDAVDELERRYRLG